MDNPKSYLKFKISKSVQYILLSVFLHFFGAMGLSILSLITKLNPPMNSSTEVQFLTPEDLALQNEKSDPVKKQDEQKLHQIVDQNKKALNDDIDPNAKYLSEHNQSVKKQTVAQHHGTFQNSNPIVSKTKATEEASNEQTSSIKKLDLSPKYDLSKAFAQNQFETQKELQTEETVQSKKIVQAEKQDSLQKEELDKTISSNSTPSQMPQSEGSQTLDYIKDLDPGLETLLSTREFVYYSYYARIREQLHQYWGPKVKERLTKLFQQGRHIASTSDKITRCLITLNKSGQLIKIQIIGNSGVRELDEAAVDSFKAAAPFINPPKGMVEADGTIRLRWDFILEV